jgi:carboxymethylenebutenolidase
VADVTLDVGGSAMSAYRGLPADADGCPGIVVCMHAPGVDGFIRGIVDRLAEAGFAAIAPDLYHRQTEEGLNPLERMALLQDAEVVPDLLAAAAHLRALPEVDAARTGVIGFCMGGRLAYLLPTHDAALRASVVFYGGNIFVPWGESEPPFDRSSRIGCPLLGLFGEDDTNPSADDVAQIDAELTRLDAIHQFVSSEGAGHAFLNEARPSFRQEAAADAWHRCVAWLDAHVATR